MGRRRTVHLNLPTGMRARVRRSGTYYYFDTGEKELPLGKDYVLAVRKWAELEAGNADQVAAEKITFRKVCEMYLASPRFAKKAPRTQKDNLGEFKFLWRFFDAPPCPLESIEPHHIAKYRDWRKSTHSTHEIALLSAVWSWAREQGHTRLPNPTADVERNRGAGRDVFIDDVLFNKVYRWADQPTRDAMDLAHLAGQRPGDSLRMKEQDIRVESKRPDDPEDWDGRVLYLQQGKTGAKLRVRVIGKLADVIDRIMARKAVIMANVKDKRRIRSLALVVNEHGHALTPSALDGRFGTARECAGVLPKDFQFRDLRAKAATEVDESAGREKAQELLGHAGPGMTKKYVRNRLGKLVNPTK